LIVLRPLILWLIKVCFKRGIAGRKVAWIAIAGLGALLRYFLEADRANHSTLRVKPGERYSVTVDQPVSRKNRRSKK